jgi:hypothetical protein
VNEHEAVAALRAITDEVCALAAALLEADGIPGRPERPERAGLEAPR